jgi:hypothetical protein
MAACTLAYGAQPKPVLSAYGDVALLIAKTDHNRVLAALGAQALFETIKDDSCDPVDATRSGALWAKVGVACCRFCC